MRESSRKHGALSPCAACKLLRRRCAEDCVFAPYFPPDEPHKFASVHKVFGASNVNKMLQVQILAPDPSLYIYSSTYILFGKFSSSFSLLNSLATGRSVMILGGNCFLVH